MSNELAYNIVKKAVADGIFLQALVNSPDVVIQNEGMTNPNEILQLKQVLLPLVTAIVQTSEVNTLMLNQLKTTMETADMFKSGEKMGQATF